MNGNIEYRMEKEKTLFTTNHLSFTSRKYFLHLSILFMTVLFVNDSVVYKLVNVFGYSISAASFVFPITYTILDIVAEVYGYRAAKQIIWLSVIFNFIFSGLIRLLLILPSPSSWTGEEAYRFVFDKALLIPTTYLIAMPIGALINTYLISKWRVLVQGKYFVIRSIASSAIGEFVFTVIAVLIIWNFRVVNVDLVKFIFITYMTKPLCTIFTAFPATLIVKILKNVEGIDMYSPKTTSFSPVN